MKLRYPHPTTVGTSSTTDYEQFGYNAVGSLISHRKRSGETITLAYDNLHRLSSRSYPTAADNVAFAYDLLGRRTQARYADNSHTLPGAQGQVLSFASRQGSRTRASSAPPRATSHRLRRPGSGERAHTTAFTYDGVGNLTQVNGPRTDVTDT